MKLSDFRKKFEKDYPTYNSLNYDDKIELLDLDIKDNDEFIRYKNNENIINRENAYIKQKYYDKYTDQLDKVILKKFLKEYWNRKYLLYICIICSFH